MRLKLIASNSTMERKFSPWIGGSILASLVSGKGPGLALTVGKGQAQCLACLIYSFNKHLLLRKRSHGPRRVNVPQDTNQGVEGHEAGVVG